MFKLEISLKRVQTFIFEVPRLKAMLGANALIGQTVRHELPALIKDKGKKLEWPASIFHQSPEDPLDKTPDPANRDNPAALYAKGILARDGGHFIVVFEKEEEAREFLRTAEATLAKRLPGVLYDARIEPFPPPKKQEREAICPRETALLDLPVLQVCQETGTAPASKQNNKGRWQAHSVTHREAWGDRFYKGETQDIIGLLRPALYPDQQQKWTEPDDLAQLTAGGYLAVIHADGNGIGKRYKEHCEKKPEASNDPVAKEVAKEAHGESFFHSMRVAVRRAVVDALAQTFTKPGGKRPYEILMLGGDDLLLVCRADRALKFAQKYAAELQKYDLADGRPLGVALGVAIAQKSYPLHRLQELAEDLASSAKRLYRTLNEKETETGTSVIDWQVVTQSWFAGVAEVRKQSERITYTVNGQTETLLLSRRPYQVTGKNSLKELLDIVKQLDSSDKDREKAARSPLRSLRSACERGRLMGEMAFKRLPQDLQAALGGNKLWEELNKDNPSIHATRALDIIGISEIARLGSKKP